MLSTGLASSWKVKSAHRQPFISGQSGYKSFPWRNRILRNFRASNDRTDRFLQRKFADVLDALVLSLFSVLLFPVTPTIADSFRILNLCMPFVVASSKQLIQFVIYRSRDLRKLTQKFRIAKVGLVPELTNPGFQSCSGRRDFSSILVVSYERRYGSSYRDMSGILMRDGA